MLRYIINISGEDNPENIQINESNSSVVDRFYPGYLVGDYIYNNRTADNVSYKNLSYSYDSSQTIYFWMDRNSTLESFIFNITGSNFGFNYYDTLDNNSNIDTISTTGQYTDGVVTTKNTSLQSFTFDNFADSTFSDVWNYSADQVSPGNYNIVVSEESGYAQILNSWTLSSGHGTTGYTPYLRP